MIKQSHICCSIGIQTNLSLRHEPCNHVCIALDVIPFSRVFPYEIRYCGGEVRREPDRTGSDWPRPMWDCLIILLVPTVIRINDYKQRCRPKRSVGLEVILIVGTR